VLVALGWVLLGLGSLASLVIATWMIGAMGEAAGAGSDRSTVFSWTIAIVATLGLPFAIAVWKHQGDARRISLTMAWLPMLWNVAGLLIATQLVPDLMASALRGHGAWVTPSEFGDSHSATRVMSALGHQTADAISPLTDPSLPTTRGTELLGTDDVDTSRALSVAMPAEGTAILMDATLEGPGGRVTLPYLFDTGASFTTMTSATAKKLGIEVPEDAPILTFNTATGPRESHMVHLPALELGRVRVDGLLVSVCDKCANDHSEGLLGLNVMRKFFVQMDYRAGRMLLLPRITHERPNRAYDVEPVVELEVEGSAELWLDRVRWVILVHNRSTMPLVDVVPVVKFAGGPTLRAARIESIEPGGTGRALVEGKATVDGEASNGHYTLGLAEAYW
jgi:clan AA aspartic protease (TIGR02281 family)